jgi:putative oxidoreductase
MNKIVSFLRLEFLPSSTDLALLVLRLWIGGSMLVLHGWGKLASFNQTAAKFADPLGIGSTASAALAVFGEVGCSILIILGFLTRFAALGGAITMGVAFFIVHKAHLTGSNSGEMSYLYLAGFVAILIAGSGKFALDGKGGGRKSAPASARK